MQFQKLPKLKIGDKVAIVSPSFAAPGVWPHVYELGLNRVGEHLYFSDIINEWKKVHQSNLNKILL